MQTGIYKHYKGGYYQVLGVARHSETDEKMAVYVSLTRPGPRMHVRPLAMFTEEVEIAVSHSFGGAIQPLVTHRKVLRFEYIGDELP